MNRPYSIIPVCLAAVLVFGCSGEKKTEPALEPAKAQPAKAEPAKPEPAKPEPAGDAKPANPSAALKSLGDALKAGAAAEGDTNCEKAYNGMKAMVEQMAAAAPDGAKKLPEKEKFIEGCGKLPEKMQQCMVLSYAMQHGEECQKARKELDPKLVEELKALMGKQ